MTTPERGLFDMPVVTVEQVHRFREAAQKHFAGLEQRLAEADKKLQDFSRSADTIWCQQEEANRALEQEIAQLRARCGELEEVVAAYKAAVKPWSGVFKGASGLRDFANCRAFWEQQPYGTRLYFDDSAMYLHIHVLEAAADTLENIGKIIATQQPAQDGQVIGCGFYGLSHGITVSSAAVPEAQPAQEQTTK